MIEIVCPSCGAQYQVPDGSIGPDGRNVTCSKCSHKWRAYPENSGEESLSLAHTEVAESSATRSEPAPVEAAAEQTSHGASAEVSGAASIAGGSREQQMDSIRRMLDDLKRNSENEPEPEPAAAAAKPGRADLTARRQAEKHDFDDAEEDEVEIDPLKSRIAQLDKSGSPLKEAKRSANYDAARLRRMHEKRARRLQKAKERKQKSGAFLTGFTLVAAVAGVMVGLYVLKPQIVASSPQMAPALNEYVVTVDRYRVALDKATAGWRAWVTKKIGPLVGNKQAGGQGQPGSNGQGTTSSTSG